MAFSVFFKGNSTFCPAEGSPLSLAGCSSTRMLVPKNPAYWHSSHRMQERILNPKNKKINSRDSTDIEFVLGGW